MKMNRPGSVSLTLWLARLGGALSLILGISVLVGWYAHNTALIQGLSGFVPMQYNTALGFLLCGFGVLAVTGGGRGAGMACGSFVMLMGALTLAEYASGIGFGIDELLMDHYVTVKTSHPGRMAPNTALSFLLAGTALAVFGTKARIRGRFGIVGILGALIFGLGTIAMVGYAIDLDTAYGWGGWTGMAIHTSVGFMVLGTTLVSLAWQRSVTTSSDLPVWFPSTVGIGVLTIMVSLWQALHARETESFRQHDNPETYLVFIDEAMLVVGIMLAVALFITVHLVQLAKLRARGIEVANRQLLAEIDERKQYEAALGESERRLEEAQKIAQLGRWELDLVNGELHWSKTIFDIFGIDPEKFGATYEAFLDAIHPDDREAVNRAYTDSLENRQPYSIEHRLLLANGSIKWVHEECRTDYDAEGKPLRSVGVVQDITAHKAIEATLRESEERYRCLFENGHTVMLVIDPDDGAIVDANPAAEAYYGWSIEELKHMKIPDINTLTSEQIQAEMQLARTEKRSHFIFRHRRAQGEPRDVEVYSGPIQIRGRPLLYSFVFDITERRQMENALRESESRLAMIIANAELATWDWNIATGHIAFNAQWAEMRGCRPEELEPHISSWEKHVHPDDLRAMSAVREEHLKGSLPLFQAEYRVRTRSGSYIWILDRGMVTERDAEGRPLRMMGIEMDITGRKQAQEKIKVSEARYRSLFEQTADYVLVMESRGEDYPVIIDANEAAFEKHGYTRSELIGKPMTFLDRNASEELMQERMRLLQPGRLVHFEAVHTCKDGSTFWADVAARSVTIGGQNLLYTIERDITGRKQMEESLRESEERYRNIFESSPIAIWEADFSAVKRHLDQLRQSGVEDVGAHLDGHPGEVARLAGLVRLLGINQASVGLLGGSSKEQIVGNLPSYLTSDALNVFKQEVIALSRGEMQFHCEIPARAVNGELLMLDLSLSVQPGREDTLSRVMISFVDVTERKRAAQELRRSLAEKVVMMREIHHRVKNNMQMMSALLDLQSGYVKDRQAQAFLRDSQQRIQSMAMIHEQLYRTESMENIDFAAYLRSLVDRLREQYSERCKQVDIRIDVQPCTLPVDIAIPCGLVVNELVSNAMKHAFPGGRSGELRISLQGGNGGRIILEVADNGVGLPAGLDIHRSQSFGLQVVTLMAEKQLHGKLTIESGQGTRVVCEIGGQNER